MSSRLSVTFKSISGISAAFSNASLALLTRSRSVSSVPWSGTCADTDSRGHPANVAKKASNRGPAAPWGTRFVSGPKSSGSTDPPLGRLYQGPAIPPRSMPNKRTIRKRRAIVITRWALQEIKIGRIDWLSDTGPSQTHRTELPSHCGLATPVCMLVLGSKSMLVN